MPEEPMGGRANLSVALQQHGQFSGNGFGVFLRYPDHPGKKALFGQCVERFAAVTAGEGVHAGNVGGLFHSVPEDQQKRIRLRAGVCLDHENSPGDVFFPVVRP